MKIGDCCLTHINKLIPEDQYPTASTFVAAKGSQPLVETSSYTGFKKDKHKRKESAKNTEPPGKRACWHQSDDVTKWYGFPWDRVNYSCAYDSLLTIMLVVY